MPGQPDDVITIHLGYGRTRAGRVGNATVLMFTKFAVRIRSGPRRA